MNFLKEFIIYGVSCVIVVGVYIWLFVDDLNE